MDERIFGESLEFCQGHKIYSSLFRSIEYLDFAIPPLPPPLSQFETIHTHIYLLAVVTPVAIYGPLPTTPENSQLSSRQAHSFDPNLKAAISRERAQGRETEASKALVDEKRAYEIEVAHGGADSAVLKGRSGRDMAAESEVRAA